MLHDVTAVWTASDAPLAGADAHTRLRRSMAAAPICLIPRMLPAAMAEALDALPADRLPRLDISGSPARVAAAVKGVAACDDEAPAALKTWLRDDMLDLAALYTAATGARALHLRLQVVQDDMCRRFHTDAVACRLLTTYRGPGTEWIPLHLLATLDPDRPLDPAAIRRLPRGAIALMRGARAATPDRPAALHRSPPVEETGDCRLLLTLNEAGAVRP